MVDYLDLRTTSAKTASGNQMISNKIDINPAPPLKQDKQVCATPDNGVPRAGFGVLDEAAVDAVNVLAGLVGVILCAAKTHKLPELLLRVLPHCCTSCRAARIAPYIRRKA